MQDSPMSTSAVAGRSSWFRAQQEHPGKILYSWVSFNLPGNANIGIVSVTLNLHLPHDIF